MGDNNKIGNNADIKVSEDREETILKILVDVGNALETLGVLGKQIKESVSLMIEERVREKESNFTFEFHEPLRKDGGFERFLMKVLNAEKEKHPNEFIYTIERNQNNEITRVKVKAEKEHLNDVSNVVNWINKRILENKSRKGGEKQNGKANS
ncbi:MAG: hypothetical protein QXZ27_00330 [Candidatus Bathyarchaeia archaeon]